MWSITPHAQQIAGINLFFQDVHWIFVYFLFSAVVVAIAAYVFPGEPEALLKLADWRGEKCGLSRNRGKPYLYFCPSEHDPDRLQKLACIKWHEEVYSKWTLVPSLGLALHDIWCLRMWYPICVSSCPQAEMITCPKNLSRSKRLLQRPFQTSMTQLWIAGMVDCHIRPIRCLMPMRAILRKTCSASSLTYTRRSAILRPCIHRLHQVVLGKHHGNPAEEALKIFHTPMKHDASMHRQLFAFIGPKHEYRYKACAIRQMETQELPW